MRVLVTYLCWGCGQEKVVVEDIEEPFVDFEEMEKWNLCEECANKGGNP